VSQFWCATDVRVVQAAASDHVGTVTEGMPTGLVGSAIRALPI
jgi:hypothetical protein